MIVSENILREGTQLRFKLSQDGVTEQRDDIVTIKDMAVDVGTGEVFLDFEEDVDLLYTYSPQLFEIYKQPWE